MKKFTVYFILSMLLPLFGACKAVSEGYGIENPGQYSRVYLAAAYNGLLSLNLEAPKPAEVKVFANYAGVLDLPADVSVTLAADFSLTDRYNNENGTSFQPLPPECFNWVNPVSVIPAGRTTASVPAVLHIITTAFRDEAPYLLPIRITAASDPSLTTSSRLETLYIGIVCTASALYVTSSPLSDFAISNTENWQ